MSRISARSEAIHADTLRAFLGCIDAALRASSVVEALGRISAAADILVSDATVYFGFYRRDAPPIVLGADREDEWNRVYPQGYYLLDPSYEAFLANRESVCLLPQQVFPRNFRSSEYYLSYCRPVRMVDEICFLLYMNADLAAYVSVMRLGAVRPYGAAEGKLLSAVLPAMDLLMRRVWELYQRDSFQADAAAHELHRHLADAYQAFGRELLSDRETEVTRLLLKGLAPKGVGRLLAIAPGTVRNHIKSIYLKLEVRTQAELMAKFFDTLSERGGETETQPARSD